MANEYYSGAVRSMASSWHAFLYGSLDAGGVMTVDKPPMALWVQALSVRVFGFSSLAMLVPQALMGVASVGLVYDLVRRRFGRAGGFAGGAVLALTPIAVAVSRHNNPDALLVLCVVGALWGVVRALEDGRVRWLVVAGACVGLGFEVKMGAALLVVPALFVAWLWAAPRNRVRGVLAGGAAMLVAGLFWPVLVWLTPAASRPWISGTSDNSIWSLIMDYNGLGRLDGQAGGPGGMGNGGPFGGTPGALRLLNDALGGQAGWLLGFAAVSGIALVVSSRLRRSDPVTGWILAAGGSALTAAIAFSFAKGIFHPYYVSELAPFIAALVGAGVARFTAGDLIARVGGPLAIAAGVVTELMVADMSWAPPLLVIGGLGAAAALAVGRSARIRNLAIATGFATLLIAPAAWSVQTLGHAASGTFPAGGPANAGGGFGGGPGGGGGAAGSAAAHRTAAAPSAGPRLASRPVRRHGGARRRHGARHRHGARRGHERRHGGARRRHGARHRHERRHDGARRRHDARRGHDGGTTAPGAGTTRRGAGVGQFGGGRGGFGGPGGGGFGGNSAALTEALAYAKANGGGTLAVSSQSTAAAAIIASHADIAGIGGFSGRESEVTRRVARAGDPRRQDPLGPRRIRRVAAASARTGGSAPRPRWTRWPSPVSPRPSTASTTAPGRRLPRARNCEQSTAVASSAREPFCSPRGWARLTRLAALCLWGNDDRLAPVCPPLAGHP